VRSSFSLYSASVCLRAEEGCQQGRARERGRASERDVLDLGLALAKVVEVGASLLEVVLQRTLLRLDLRAWRMGQEEDRGGGDQVREGSRERRTESLRFSSVASSPSRRSILRLVLSSWSWAVESESRLVLSSLTSLASASRSATALVDAWLLLRTARKGERQRRQATATSTR